jgi:transcriptional regulator with XRE-family HTH domain
MSFGEILRELRTKSGVGIKRLAPELGVDYTYLSKLESNQVRPSEQLIDRVALYFAYDRDLLLLSADRVPADIRQILRDNPQDAVNYLRERFGSRSDARPEP